MMFDLTGRTALVTGASGGIGGAIAQALHRQGATVALSGTRRDALDKLAAQLGEVIHRRKFQTILARSRTAPERMPSGIPSTAPPLTSNS